MTAHLIKIESTPDLVEQVYASLLDAISDGTLPPGARIMQEDIAEQLAVSRQPVLQALRMLRKELRPSVRIVLKPRARLGGSQTIAARSFDAQEPASHAQPRTIAHMPLRSAVDCPASFTASNNSFFKR